MKRLHTPGALAALALAALTIPAGAVPQAASATDDGEIWIEGVVLPPEGATLDEEIAVVARDSSGELLQRQTLDEEGQFRFAVPADLSRVELDLEAETFYLEQPRSLRLRQATEKVKLLALRGGSLYVTLVLPDEEAAEQLIGETVRVASWKPDLDGASRVDERRAELGPDLTLHLTQLDPELMHSLDASPAHFLPFGRRYIYVDAGQQKKLSIEVSRGVRLSGRVVDEDGQLLPDARVSVEHDPRQTNWTSLPSLRLGTSGHFQLGPVAPGELTVVGRCDGYLQGGLPLGSLKAGAVIEDLELVLRRGESLAGRVEWSDGRPAGGCEIVIRQPHGIVDEAGRALLSFFRTTADADGAFEVGGLSYGFCQLTAELIPLTGDHPRRVPYAWAILNFVEPGTRDLLLVLDTGSTALGRVVDDTGAPVPGARVQSDPGRPQRSRPDWGTGNWVGPRTVTDADGAFTLGGLGAGSWGFSADAPGYSPAGLRRVTVPLEEPLVIELPRAVTVSGTVVGPDGEPIDGARIVIAAERYQHGAMRDRGDARVGFSGADGLFTLTRLPVDHVTLRAESELFCESEPTTLFLAPGEHRQDLVLRLRRGGSLEARVFGEDGELDPDERIYLAGPTSRGGNEPDDEGRTVIDSLLPGTYQVSTSPNLYLDAGGWYGTPEGGVRYALARRTATVQVVAGETTRVELRPAGEAAGRVRLVGRVLAGEQGLAAWEVRAHRLMDWEGWVAWTDATGAYELLLPGPGRYAVSIGDDLSNRLRAVTVPELDEVRHDFFAGSASLSGRALDHRGEPLPGARVRVEMNLNEDFCGPSTYSATNAGPDGRFRIDHLEPGLCGISLTTEPAFLSVDGAELPVYGFSPLLTLELGEGDAVEDLELRLEPGGSIFGTVREPGGRPVPGAQILVHDSTGRCLRMPFSTHSDTAGRYRIDGCVGPVTVWACAPGMASPARDPIDVRPGSLHEFDLELGPGTALRIEVADDLASSVGRRYSVLDEAGREFALGRHQFGHRLHAPPIGDHPWRILGPLPPGEYDVAVALADGRTARALVRLDGQEYERVLLAPG